MAILKRFLPLLLILSALGEGTAFARRELLEFYRGVRPMGMGNAFTAISDDHNAVFYNPAGIALNSGFRLNFMNPKFETSTDNFKLASEIRKISSSGFNADAMRALLGKNIYGNATIYPSIMIPHLTIGYFADFNAHMVANNQALPMINLNYYYDQGVVGGTGFGFSIGKFHHMRFGLAAKALYRRGVDRVIPITTLATGSNVLKSLTSDTGFGVGVSPGLQYEHPLSPRTDMYYGVVWHDIGDTKFGNRFSDTNRAPPSIPSNLAAGATISQRFSKGDGYSAKFSIEGRHLNRTGEDPRKKIHFGGELSLGLLSVRAGMSQLRWTAGLGVDLYLFQIEAASYAVENLSLWGQSTERRYAVQFSWKFEAGGGRDRSQADRERRRRPRNFK